MSDKNTEETLKPLASEDNNDLFDTDYTNMPASKNEEVAENTSTEMSDEIFENVSFDEPVSSIEETGNNTAQIEGHSEIVNEHVEVAPIPTFETVDDALHAQEETYALFEYTITSDEEDKTNFSLPDDVDEDINSIEGLNKVFSQSLPSEPIDYKDDRGKKKTIKILAGVGCVLSLSIALLLALDGDKSETDAIIGVKYDSLSDNSFVSGKSVKAVNVDDPNHNGIILDIDKDFIYVGSSESKITDDVLESYVGQTWDVVYDELWDHKLVENYDYKVVSQKDVRDKSEWVVSKIENTNGLIFFLKLS